MTYQECVNYILSIPLFATKLGTDNLNQILDVMGHPERCYSAIHVAGTNGKGSTCCFLASILQKAKKKVGLFTSPHLIKINERFRIGDEIISDMEFVETFEETMRYVKIAKSNGIAHPSFFEFVFLMAVIYFKNKSVDYAIIETGMGGRLDATNVVMPIVSVITSVGLDHTQFLGESIEEIAKEKAGIMKKDIPVVYFDRKNSATEVLSQKANEVGTDLFLVEKNQYKIHEITEKTIDFSFQSGYYSYDSLQIPKTALYQVENAVLAIKTYEILNIQEKKCDGNNDNCYSFHHDMTNIDCIQEGLENMVWKGRMECLSENIYIDGAHNEEAIHAFCQTVDTLFSEESKILLFAVSQDKDYEKMIQRLCDVSFSEIIIVQYDNSRCADIATVKETFSRFSDSKIITFDNMREGFFYGKNQVSDSVLFCVGSLYLVGDLLRLGV